MSISDILAGGIRGKGIKKTSITNFPLVSVITVVYNGEKFLEQTILSVINQTYKNIEYIIIDGGSTDSTCNIIRNYDTRIDYWVSEADKGIYDAMNKGISYANGELIGIINSDDWYEENTITEIVEKYVRNRDIGVFHGIHRLWDKDGLLGVIGHSDLFLKYGMISHPTCFIAKSVYEKYGLYSCKYKIVSDYEIMLRFKSKDVKFLFIEKIITNFRNNGLSNQFKGKVMLETMLVQSNYSIISKKQLILYKIGYYFRSMFLS